MAKDLPRIPHYGVIPRNPDADKAREEIVFFEENNPRCVVNLLTDKVKAEAKQVPPEYLAMSEDQLALKLEPSEIDEMLRIAFWDEYFLTVDNNLKSMRMSAIYARICTRETFYQVIRNPMRFAYVLKPPRDYMLQMRSLLNIGLNRFSEILRLPLDREAPDTKLIAELVKIVTILDNRVRGAVVQKVQIESKNVNMNVEAPKTHAEIIKELKNLEAEIRVLEGSSSKDAPSVFDHYKEDEGEMRDVGPGSPVKKKV